MFANQETKQDLGFPPLGEPDNSGLIDSFARESLLKGQSERIHTSNLQEVAWRAPSGSQGPYSFHNQTTSCAPKTDVSLASHIGRARAAVAELLEGQRRLERTRLYEQALTWVARNRQMYVGQWIAVHGSQLLATGTNARDVHARVRGLDPPALIVRIEREDLPFAGW
jgi:hypothetical protein